MQSAVGKVKKMTGIVMCAETIAKPENKVIAHKNPKKH